MRYINQAGRNGTIMVRVPNTKQRNFHRSQLAEAIAHRDKLCALTGNNIHAPKKRTITKSYSTKREGLPLGVAIIYNRKILAGGEEAIYLHAQASFMVGRKQVSKSFSLAKYGREEAIRMAIEWRETRGRPLG